MHIPAWLLPLAPHAARLSSLHLRELCAADPRRVSGHSLKAGPVHICFARQRLDEPAWSALDEMARAHRVPEALKRLFDGAVVNCSEARPALHTALRSDLGSGAEAVQARRNVLEMQTKMAALVARLEDSPVTDLVHVGIGGSDLGPRLVLEALRDLDPGRFRLHFVSTVDAVGTAALLAGLDPARTAVVLVSKSFRTRETLLNGRQIRDWLPDARFLHAVTAEPERAVRFGVPQENLLPLWPWVGGRYSLWSAVSFSVAAALGMPTFLRLLEGAARMDRHVLEAPPLENMAIRHALVSVWNRNALGFPTHALLAYDNRLEHLSAWLRQLVMESLGKSVSQHGDALMGGTSPVLWGGLGLDIQHSALQCLHQGTDIVPVDFVGVIDNKNDAEHRLLLSNLLAQAEVLANGHHSERPEQVHPGNRPSTILLLESLSPEALGALLALYEHSVFVQATIWGLNPFDQWGVELGKGLAARLDEALRSGADDISDPVTRLLLRRIEQVVSDQQ